MDKFDIGCVVRIDKEVLRGMLQLPNEAEIVDLRVVEENRESGYPILEVHVRGYGSYGKNASDYPIITPIAHTRYTPILQWPGYHNVDGDMIKVANLVVNQK